MSVKNQSIHLRYLLSQIDKVDLEIKRLQAQKQSLCDEANAIKLSPQEIEDLKREHEVKKQQIEQDLII